MNRIEVNIPWLENASKRKKFLVGVSGGLDSMALLHLLHRNGFRKIVICHLNHGLRGGESAGDARFVKRVAQRLGFPVEAEKVNLLKGLESSSDSLETFGRKARHLFFAKCGRKHRCNAILLAHHADDQAETVLWNLARGALGCRGMSEITDFKMDGRKMSVVRPLLKVRKSELTDWMGDQGLKWREDASNSVNDVVRNRLRNEAVPLLSEISRRDIVPALVRAAETDSQWRDLMDWSVEHAGVIDPQGRLHVNAMRGLPEILKRAVFADFIRGVGISKIDQDLLCRCVGLLDVTTAARVNLPDGGCIRRRSGRIFVEQE